MNRLPLEARDLSRASVGLFSGAPMVMVSTGQDLGSELFLNLVDSFSIAQNSLENDRLKNAEGEYFRGSCWEIKHSFFPSESELQASDSCLVVIAEQNVMAVLKKVVHELHFFLGSV